MFNVLVLNYSLMYGKNINMIENSEIKKYIQLERQVIFLFI